MSGNGTNWENTANLLVGNPAQNTSYTDNDNDYSKIISATSIQWSIPANSSIQSVTLTLNVNQLAGTSAVYSNIWLLGVPGAVEKHTGPWGSGPHTYTYTWTAPPAMTAAMLSAPGFGWAFQTTNTGEPGTGCVTNVVGTITATYTPPAPVPPSYVAGTQCGSFNVFGTGSVTVESVAVTPSNPSIEITDTQQFTAIATYSDEHTTNVTTLATWMSSNTAEATVDSSGLATGVGDGNPTITATYSGVPGSTVLTVYGIPTLLQAGGSNFNNGSAVIIGITNNPTPGNLLVALAFCAPENVGPVVGITGFIEQATYTNAGQDGTVWVGTRVVQAGDGKNYTVNFTGSAGGGDIGGVLYEISNWTSTASSAGLASVLGQIASTPNMTAGEAITFAVLVLPFGTTTNTYTPSDFIESASNRGVWAGYYVGNVSAVPVTETFTGGLISPALYALVQITR